ncbi:hypothetical protein THICB2_210008 [Thiomonas sp. CB2]|nr:hypothetical protein THICB2_210008 [Thiomonas sp. CB2]VDY05821.1 protein of unknown function [Thiomonas sp. Bio17B3]VDY10881.1 protein of unknown function [Thiomonas sp. Sup16B3]VDY14080.1 conserved protein of unknown function [Thiomonas sp. OC7]VDY16726.1 protein of unknown function [Thiomonas sp. CB2]
MGRRAKSPAPVIAWRARLRAPRFAGLTTIGLVTREHPLRHVGVDGLAARRHMKVLSGWQAERRDQFIDNLPRASTYMLESLYLPCGFE